MQTVLCSRCRGEKEITCINCDGTGRIEHENFSQKISTDENKNPSLYDNNSDGKCKECNGTGKVKCPSCLGGGIVDMTAMA